MSLYTRRSLLAATAAAWLPGQDTRVWPARQPSGQTGVLPASPALLKVLTDAAALPDRPVAATTARRAVVERAFRECLGLNEWPQRTPLEPRIVAKHDLPGYTLENVVFQSRPGFFATGNLYRPAPAAPRRHAAILSPIGHYLTPGKAHPTVQARAIGLARLGFVVFTYDALGQGERMVPGNVHHDAGYALLPFGETIAGWMVWDSIRALDFLMTLPDVDPTRLGMTGNSGGGLNTLFTAALDARVRAAAVAGFTFEFRNWMQYGGSHCTCTHLPGWVATMAWHEVAGLIAPRALLLLQGEADAIFPAAGARRSAAAVREIYRALGQPAQMAFVELRGQPHDYSRPFREPMYAFFERWLMGRRVASPSPENDVAPLPENDVRLRTGAAAGRSVVAWAEERSRSVAARPGLRPWLRRLAAVPDLPLLVQTHATGSPAKITLQSEEGLLLPALFWPSATPRGAVLLADGRGKAYVADMAAHLARAGYAVLAPDLRGTGELLDEHRPGWDINFRLTAAHVLTGRPLAACRAVDLARAAAHLQQQTSGTVTLVAIGTAALPAWIAALVHSVIGDVAVAGSVHGFGSLMRARDTPLTGNSWNDPQLRGTLHAGDYTVNFDSVLPGALRYGDLPVWVGELAAGRRVLFAQAVDRQWPGAERWRQAWAKLGATGAVDYRPEEDFTADQLLAWLSRR